MVWGGLIYGVVLFLGGGLISGMVLGRVSMYSGPSVLRTPMVPSITGGLKIKVI